MNTFVQLGATRDGLDSYLQAAHTYGMDAVLIETPDYIHLRRALGRKEFDHTLAVEHPANVAEVLAALASYAKPAYILAGFERYIYAAYALATRLNLPPYQQGQRFFPPDKAEQRNTFACYPALVPQPAYVILDERKNIPTNLADLKFPVVLKPIDGAGGLGVFLVTQPSALNAALRELSVLTNYDGGLFKGLLIEEFLPGTEYSVQGIVSHGDCVPLTFCKKFVLTEPLPDMSYLYSFREVGHMAVSGTQIPPDIDELIKQCMGILGYESGPFHADIVHSQGKYYLLELGFRLSGSGLVQVVERVSGHDWAAHVFATHLNTFFSFNKSGEVGALGQITAISEQELATARALQKEGYEIQIRLFNTAASLRSQSLTSDLVRHGGFLGHITACGQNLEEVEEILQCCSPSRAITANMPATNRLSNKV